MPDASPDLPAMSPLAVYRQAVEQRGFAPDEADDAKDMIADALVAALAT